MLGDVLKSRIKELSKASTKKVGDDAFWVILRNIAKDEIIELYPKKVDSDTIVPIYFEILSSNETYIPKYFKEKLDSNHQERYRVINRNLFTSNAFHPDGLANQEGITAYKDFNESKKGERIVYQGDVNYANKQ
ncbi:MAG: hypothetical protein IKF36_06075 [Bacilli bacterium]|nr:hypothetical protein [Bacilli bacterium]